MRRTWGSIGILAVLLAALAGCEPTLKQKLRPPDPPERYDLPPVEDARFQKPIEFPKGTLNQDEIKKLKEKDDANAKQGPGGGGMGGKMGGGLGGGPGGGMGGP
jgi:hypothetical protein